MIQQFVDAFIAQEEAIKSEWRLVEPDSYEDLVKRVVMALADARDSYEGNPDAERITVIDHGDYQGTLLFIIGARGYQPSKFWSIFVNYGSCSGCDSFQGIGDDFDGEEKIGAYWTMALHMVQSMKDVRDGDPDAS